MMQDWTVEIFDCHFNLVASHQHDTLSALHRNWKGSSFQKLSQAFSNPCKPNLAPPDCDPSRQIYRTILSSSSSLGKSHEHESHFPRWQSGLARRSSAGNKALSSPTTTVLRFVSSAVKVFPSLVIMSVVICGGALIWHLPHPRYFSATYRS